MIRRFLRFAVGVGALCMAAAFGDEPKPVPKAAAPTAPPVVALVPAAADDDIQDLLYMDEKRPMRIRLHVRVNGKPFRQRWEDFMGRLFAYADFNEDKFLSKDEALRIPPASLITSLLQGQFLALGGGGEPLPFAELDADKNGKVSVEEMKLYYRKAGCGPVMTLPDREQNLSQPMTDALLKLLDKDGDGKLSEEEMKAAEEAVLTLDTNEDDLITVSEMIPGFEYGFGRRFGVPMMPGQTNPLSLINRDESAAQQVAPLLTRYDKDKNGTLSRAEIGLAEAVFVSLDANKDGKLDAKELANWLGQPADLELLVPLREQRVFRPKQSPPQAPQGEEKVFPIELFNPALKALPLAATLCKRGATDLDMTTATSLFEFHAERSSSFAFDKLRQFYQEQFQGALKDKTFVDKKAVKRNQFLNNLLAHLDRDGDGKVTEAEFKVFFDLMSHCADSFAVVLLTDGGQCLFELLDTDHDKQLSLRELRGIKKSLAAWDANKDGAISKQEVPRLYQVTLSAGPPARFGSIFGPEEGLTPTAAKERTAGPLWFRKMDVNGDGDVSRREWLGKEEDFGLIDTDGDGLIDLQEAEKADALMRKKLESEGKGK